MRYAGLRAMLAGGLLLVVAGIAPAQMTGGNVGSGFGSGGSPGGGGSGFGSGGSGGASGTSASGPLGAVTFGSGPGTGGTAGGTPTYGTTSFMGRYYGTPLYNGLVTGQSNNSSASASKYLRQPPEALSFGNLLFNNSANVSRTPNQIATGALNTQPYSGATSAGIRRSPGYVTEPVIDMPPRPSMVTMQPELQSVVSRASRLPSRDNIQVFADGEVIILRGQVRDERERRLAEAVIRLMPGVCMVRNELEPMKRPVAK